MYRILPEVLQTGFTATLSATRWGNFQPWLEKGLFSATSLNEKRVLRDELSHGMAQDLAASGPWKGSRVPAGYTSAKRRDGAR